jgi:hypothetical protein
MDLFNNPDLQKQWLDKELPVPVAKSECFGKKKKVPASGGTMEVLRVTSAS